MIPTSLLEGEHGMHPKIEPKIESDETMTHLLKPHSVCENASINVTKTVTSTGGARITANTNPEKGIEKTNEIKLKVKEEIDEMMENESDKWFEKEELKAEGVTMETVDEVLQGIEEAQIPETECQMEIEEKEEEKKVSDSEKSNGSGVRCKLTFEEWLKLPENNPIVKQEKLDKMESETTEKTNEPSNMAIVKVKEQINTQNMSIVEKEVQEIVFAQPISSVSPISNVPSQKTSMNKPCYIKKRRIEENVLSTVLIEDGDFPEEPDWLLVGRSIVTGLSTTKGRKLENNEIVHFAIPDYKTRTRDKYTTNKAANAVYSIIRFSTKRNGEIGRLTNEWSSCLIPLVNSEKVKVLGRCISAPNNLHTFQEIMLYVSFYIHHSVFTVGETSSWKLEHTHINCTTYPLLKLFSLLKINPFQKAEFTPEELDSRKRSLNLGSLNNDDVAALPIAKRRMGCTQYPEENKDEQVISESSLNKIVGATDVYDLKEMDPPDTLMCNLRPYQKQALYWMSESEKGVDIEEAQKMLHPCWAGYRICDKRASEIYINNFTGEATITFPAATQMARGGILADAMGLGKTVMTISLILARKGRGSPDVSEIELTKDKRKAKVKGGTLIICPMALLSQWKDELETHSTPDSLSVFVHYGGGRANEAKLMAEYDVVLTTYGVLTAAYKTDMENSIFHQVEWYRVVLDEAHTIKSSKTQGAQAAYTLLSYCRWCLTGTPLQNSLEDLYSLLCFLHVEPWCNWAWWHKLIQRPYENGDKRGLNLIKSILRPLMLRRTKETKDKQGRPILVLPPTDIQVIECEQSEAEHDFYNALFKRSKVQFDQFVAQGKVLHNFANILELLLRLRQCCNHPFLVMSRGDNQEYADLNKLARKFLETNLEKDPEKAPTRAYIEEVVEGLKNGENTECPICMESADDPVLTPCAHRMCRECLLSCWKNPMTGFCPICRQLLRKNELITCPSDNRFRIDVHKNWKESSKVTKLLDCLKQISKRSGHSEKSIVFSQWTSFLDLLEIPLKERKIGYLRFDGRLSQKQREKVLKEFNETSEKTVLLMSLRAGGVGLNLTAASNVFLMDPWWNPAVEEQAIMRIHRIGQKRTVHVRRFIVKDTVEERMQQVQARKQHLIAGALTDEDVRSARIEELKMLFR